MGVTHVIRGDDHLNNAARQTMVYQAMGWDVPVWAHIPLIHGPDGKKLSKRHGATAVQEVAFTFADAIAYVQQAVDTGLAVDAFAPYSSPVLLQTSRPPVICGPSRKRRSSFMSPLP